MDKINIIKVIQNMLYCYQNNRSLCIGVSIDKEQNPMMNSYIRNIIKTDISNIDKLYVIKAEYRKLYIALLKDNDEYSTNNDEYIKYFSTYFDGVKYTLMTIHPKFLSYDNSKDTKKLFKNVGLFVNAIISSEVFSTESNNGVQYDPVFNTFERDYFVFYLIYELMAIYGKIDNLKEDMDILLLQDKIERSQYSKTRVEFSKLDYIFEWFGDTEMDNDEIINRLFRRLEYLSFIDGDLKMEDYLKWEKSYHSH